MSLFFYVFRIVSRRSKRCLRKDNRNDKRAIEGARIPRLKIKRSENPDGYVRGSRKG